MISGLAVNAELSSQTGSFFESNKLYLEELYGVLGQQHEWSEDLSDVVTFTQNNWISDTPWNLDTVAGLQEPKQQKARALLAEIGVINAVNATPGHYDQIIVLGAMARANDARVGYVADRLKSGQFTMDGGQLMFWGGPRARTTKEDDPLALVINALPQSTTANPWLKHQLRLSDETQRPFDTEADGGRLTLLRHLGDMSLQRTQLDLVATGCNSLETSRIVSRYHLKPQGLDADVVIMNARPQARKIGKSRHTTEQCAREWLETMPPEQGAHVLMAVNNPSIERTGKVVKSIIEQYGRHDIHFEAAGPAAYSDATIGGSLAEVGRLLFMDYKFKAV